ncbi:Protoporphyrinogen oxidase [Backusella circina FSU 941]|nr:Protoporphyrinogen oxidase [Backusella circina FSU 941]
MTSVAILGGGISGLSAAYYLAKASPKTKVILIESTNRVGGWIRSQRVELSQKDNVLFEMGPRTLRPVGAGGAAIIDMVRELNLKNDMLSVSKQDPSAKNRYIYYKNKINKLPNSLSSLLLHSPPVFQSVIKSILKEPFVQKGDGQDESLYSFVARRFNDHVALNLVGAITHGIYAGDAKQLSVKSTMRLLYDNEQIHGSVVQGMLRGGATVPSAGEERIIKKASSGKVDDTEWFEETRKASVFGFKEGSETLTRRLQQWLKEQPNVTLLVDKEIRKIKVSNDGNSIKLYDDHTSVHVNHIISTIPSRALEKLVVDNPLPHLSANPAVNVMVANFAYEQSLLKYDGFGFLVPHPDSHYKVPVPGTLGVVFDSNALRGQDTREDITKLTVMMGGHMWESTFGKVNPNQVDPMEAQELAKKVVQTYLGIDHDSAASKVSLLQECIPQYTVGHEERLKELHTAISQKYNHLLSVSGASYLGVSVPDCVKNSRLLVHDLLEKGVLGTREQVVTGLNKLM